MYLKIMPILLCLILITLLPSCGQPPPKQAEDGEEVLPIDYPKKGNPKLDSHLWELIDAEKRGEAESLAQRWGRGSDLKDSKVRVTIEHEPGQVEAAAEAAIKAGAELLPYYKMPGDPDWLPAFVPITSLEALANEKSIRFIELPIRPAKETQ